MSDNVILIGAGGHAKVIADMVLKSGDHLIGFLDDDTEKTEVMGCPVLGPIGAWREFTGEAMFLLALGSSSLREKLAGQMKVRWYTAIHPAAQIGADVVIGEGTTVMANAVLNPGARIGRHCIVNTAAVVEHDNQIGDYVHISVGARLGGTVQIGKGSWVGIGAVIKNNVSVCGGCMVGAGAVVVKDLAAPGVYVGIPARKVKK